MKKKTLLSAILFLSGLCGFAQSLEKMNWFNEPDN